MPFKPKECKLCKTIFQPGSGAAKVCDACRPEWKKLKMKEYHSKNYKQKGRYKWEMPKAKESPFYKTGIGVFVKIAFEHYPYKCNRCESTKNLCVHHKDKNRHNNVVENLEIVCKSCHQKEHLIRDEKGRFAKQHL